jgi:hypothetical protein
VPLQPGQILELRPGPAIYAPGAEAEMQRLFPQGVSAHGVRYLAEWPPGDQWPTWAVEAFFEAVRRGEHPQKPSRLTSVFAFETEDEALAFAAKYRRTMPVGLWRVDGEVRQTWSS